MVKTLSETTLLEGVDFLCRKDKKLASITAAYGPPPLWPREEGFAALLRIILEQQVSLQSAKAAYDRLEAALGQITPKSFLTLTDEQLKRIGFSRQKIGYGRGLANELLLGTLDLHSLSQLSDDEVRKELIKVKGIGPWTANIYLLMTLKRPDIWPSGDLALELAVQKLLSLEKKPTSPELERISSSWRPWRAVAARMLYHYYLCENNRSAA